MKNKILTVILAGCVIFSTACSTHTLSVTDTSADQSATTAPITEEVPATQSDVVPVASSDLKVVCTIFPIYDWVTQISGGAITPVLLLDDAVDLHSYQPSVADMNEILSCDLFIYMGGESDSWVDDVFMDVAVKAKATGSGLRLFDISGVNLLEETLVAGMQSDEEHEHDHAEDENDEDEDHEHAEDEDHEHTKDEEVEYDEHAWLSLSNASLFIRAISQVLISMDPPAADMIAKHTEDYLSDLSMLNEEFISATTGVGVNTLLFADRFPFAYLVNDYGLNYYAAFLGCSAETEASFETVAFLTRKVDELNLKHVIVLEGSDCKIADTIINNTQTKLQTILTMNSLQSVTQSDIAAGKTYLSVMRENLLTLITALH